MKKIATPILVYSLTSSIYAQIRSSIFENMDAFKHYPELMVFIIF